LLNNRHELIDRYRNSLGDLAHSLKTPLAVLRGMSETNSGDTKHTLDEQLDHMSRIVEYQLQKAAASGSAVLTSPIAVRKVAEKIVNTLQKVYAEKQVQCTLDIHDDIIFHGDEGDLLEVLGNLMDNAFKWCTRRVALSGRIEPEKDALVLCLQISDDGPGIPDTMADKVLERGVRADAGTAGHGIGLAVVREIVRLYHGRLTLGRGAWQGAEVTVCMKNL
jgi:two-component system sensor histidine kinase PhoQ